MMRPDEEQGGTPYPRSALKSRGSFARLADNYTFVWPAADGQGKLKGGNHVIDSKIRIDE
jgi:hypothetical protein